MHARRHRLLLSTAAFIGALTGYGRSAHAVCAAGAPPTFTSSDANVVEQSITLDDATVSTVLGFSVDTPDIRGVDIQGNGALSYTDDNASPLSALNEALHIRSFADIVSGNDGSVTVSTGGMLTGGDAGMTAINSGSGVMSITTSGDVTANNVNSSGIYANTIGSTLDVTTGPGSTVTGGNFGIRAINRGESGATTINAYGNVYTAGDSAISAVMDAGAGGDLSVTTHGGAITGGNGVSVTHAVAGNVTVNTGAVTGNANDGIFITKSGSGNVAVTTGTGTVRGADEGISVLNSGAGATTINTNGYVYGDGGDGIFLLHSADGAVSVTTAAGATLTGQRDGIRAINNGDSTTNITTNGDVTANTGHGINAQNGATGTDLTVTTDTTSSVTGDSYGIRADNGGAGTLTLNANGEVMGSGAYGIYARNAGTDIALTTGADSSVTGELGVRSRNNGTGSSIVRINGNVEGTTDTGVFVQSFGTYLTASTGTGSDVTGATRGLDVRNFGTGELNLTVNGDVTGMAGYGIFTRNNGAGLNLTTATGTTVMGSTFGIYARHFGTGELNVTANGDVSGATRGIFAATTATNTNLVVTTGANRTVSGGAFGIFADGNGTGSVTVTTNGSVTTTTGVGIDARNSGAGADLTVTTVAGTTVTGVTGGIAATNDGSGAVDVTANGDVYSTFVDSDAILVRNSATGTNVTVSTGAGSIVESADANGIDAINNGSGTMNITANGNVTGVGAIEAAIYARNYGTDLTVTTGVGTAMVGGRVGIEARNDGNGAVNITANGNVSSISRDGIFARNFGGTDINVTTGANTTVTGFERGLRAINYGVGAVNIAANGDASGGTNDGISAQNFVGTDVTVTTAAGTTISGGRRGIVADNSGTGEVEVTANGSVTGTLYEGIYARNTASGTDLRVTTAAGSTVMGGTAGVRALGNGDGEVEIATNGDVTGTDFGIFGQHGGTGDLNVTTSAGITLYGGTASIYARHYGNGTVNVTPNGDVSGGSYAIYALHEGTGDLNVTTNANTTVMGDTGIFASHTGAGALNLTPDGDVIGTLNDGIFASRAGGAPIGITVNSGVAVTSNGVDADDFAVQTYGGAASVIVAGTLNGGVGGALEFDQVNDLDDRLELRPTAIVNGDAFAGGGTDTLAFAGTGNGSFDLADIDTGADTQQYRAFETFVVESATWTMNGVTSADFIVEGGTLKGNGTFGDLTVNGGTLSPGNSFGTMTVNGAFTLNAGAIFEVEVNAANQGDVVVVNGTVNLTGATLRVLAAPGDYELETDYVIIDNDGTDAVSGVFGTITSTLAFLIPAVAYDGGTGNDVVLTLTRNEVDPCDVADTQNQSETCEAIDKDNPLYDEIIWRLGQV